MYFPEIQRTNLSEGEKTILEAILSSECNFQDQFFFTTALIATMECNNTVTSLKLMYV